MVARWAPQREKETFWMEEEVELLTYFWGVAEFKELTLLVWKTILFTFSLRS